VNGLKFTTGGLMGLVALFAVDFVVVTGMARGSNPLARIGLFGALPMVHGLAIYHVLLGARLRRQGEIGLPSGVFLLAGGALVLVLGLIAGIAPQVRIIYELLTFYVDNTAGLWIRPGETVRSIYLFGVNGIDPLRALLVFAAITPLLVIPALLAGRAAHGYRLRLEKSDDGGGPPWRVRITVSCLVMIIAVIAVDCAVLPVLRGPGNRALISAMPMADLLTVLLATTALSLRRRDEAPLSHVMFLIAGGMALVFLVYLVQLRPDLYDYLLNTAWRRGGGNPLVKGLVVWLAVSMLILVPALIAGWATRGYRLKLTTSAI
jgi:hypothetical protein